MTNPTRLLIAFHDLGLGGIQKKVVDISQYLHRTRPDIPVRISLRRRIGIFLDQLPQNVVVSAPRRPLYRLGTIRFLLWMIKEILLFNPTHILTFMDFSAVPTIIALRILFWKKIPITIGEDILTSKYLPDLYGPIQGPIRQKLIKKYYPMASRILVQTPIQKHDLEKILNLPNSSKIIATPNWLSLNYPPIQSKKIKRDIDILYVGRIAAQKNLPQFIDIVRLLKITNPRIKAVIVGVGEHFSQIKKSISKNRLTKNITMVGSQSNPQNFYRRAKFFLLTSDYEGFPLTLMEAISCGCYPVCRNLPEITQFFRRHPSRFLFDHANTAVTILSRPQSTKYLAYYQQKLKKLQLKNLWRYLKFCLSV